MVARRWLFAGILAFWGSMNVLLWKSEVSGSQGGGSPVSTDVVLERLLTAADPSTLEVRYQGKGAGYLHWYPDSGDDDAPGRRLSTQYVPEGMSRKPEGYSVRLEGHLQVQALELRTRFQLQLHLDTNRLWRALAFEAGTKPNQFKVSAAADTRTLTWSFGSDAPEARTTVSLDDLKDPANWSPAAAGAWTPLVASLAGQFVDTPNLAKHLEWQARSTWIPLGHSKVRAYRLRTTVFGRHTVELLINRAGEILRVELPNGLQLVNEGIGGF